MLLQNLKAPKEEGSACICKCVWVCVGVSVNMHIQGDKSFKKITEYPPPFLQGKEMPKIFELIILSESFLQLKAIPAFPEKLSVQYM